jgi:chemotaxis protein histidine kinase CheA
VLFSLADVTHLESAERLARENGRLVRILGSRDSFVDFLIDTRSCLVEAYRASYQHDRTLLLQDLHTIKGNAAMFGLDEVARMVHVLEERPEINGADLNCIELEIRRFLDDAANILNIRWDDLDNVVLSIPSTLLQKVELANHAADIAALRRELAEVISESKKRRIFEIIGPIADRTEQMALNLNKEVKVEVTGAHMIVPQDYLKPVLKNIIHLLRNAVDHGIEFPRERGGKAKVATIIVAFSEDDFCWRINVSDDGRGIDSGLIAQKAVERGIISIEQSKSMAHAELEQLVFVSGFSTADKASDISGRGRGTSAARDAVVALGGEIMVSSSLGKGTSFVISIPKPI